MKKLTYIFIILLTASCKNALHNNFHAEKIVLTDTVATEELPEYKADTLSKISNPFLLNKLLCYWEHFFVIYHYGGLEITMKLYDYKSKKLLLKYEYQPKYEEDYDYKFVAYFDSINKRHFDDFNFDGYKDFTIYEYGSMPMTSATVIMLFNNEAKTFEHSELSAPVIEEIDSVNKILTTHEWDMENAYYKKYHFNKNGKINFIENYTYPNDTAIVHYKKIINDKIVEQRTETIKE